MPEYNSFEDKDVKIKSWLAQNLQTGSRRLLSPSIPESELDEFLAKNSVDGDLARSEFFKNFQDLYLNKISENDEFAGVRIANLGEMMMDLAYEMNQTLKTFDEEALRNKLEETADYIEVASPAFIDNSVKANMYFDYLFPKSVQHINMMTMLGSDQGVASKELILPEALLLVDKKIYGEKIKLILESLGPYFVDSEFTDVQISTGGDLENLGSDMDKFNSFTSLVFLNSKLENVGIETDLIDHIYCYNSELNNIVLDSAIVKSLRIEDSEINVLKIIALYSLNGIDIINSKISGNNIISINDINAISFEDSEFVDKNPIFASADGNITSIHLGGITFPDGTFHSIRDNIEFTELNDKLLK